MRFLTSILLFLSLFLPAMVYGQVADDNFSTDEDTPVSFSITGNDSSPDGINAATVDLDTSTPGVPDKTVTISEGTFTVDNAGQVSFTPTADIFGTAQIQYSVKDGLDVDAGTASITVTINSVNDNPVAADDNATTTQNTPVDFNIVTNDSDVEGALDGNGIDLNLILPLQQTSVTTLAGTFEVVSPGVIRFTPFAIFSGSASTSYRITDSNGGNSNVATITVDVTPNAPPDAKDDAVSTNENVDVDISILANDTDDGAIDASSVDLNPALILRQTSVSVTGGTFSVDNSGLVTFSPTTGYNGTATASYTVQDNLNATSNAASITVTVNAVNVSPVANDDTGSTNENTPGSFTILSNDTDDVGLDGTTVDLDPATAGQQTSRTVTGGTFTVNGSGVLLLTPTPNYNGSAIVTYTVEDSENAVSNAATVTITVNSVNADPVANNDAATTDENVAVSIKILDNDTDDVGVVSSTVDIDLSTPGQQLTRIVTGGTFEFSGDELSFAPTVNFNGTATVTYTVDDTEGATSNIATVTVTVSSVNANPVANNDSGTTNENDPVTILILVNDTDDVGLATNSVDLDPAAASQQTSKTVTGGTFSVSGGSLLFTPNTNFNGTASVTYTVNDTEGATSNIATVTVTISSVNANPVANNDTGVTDENDPVDVSILTNDTDDVGLAVNSVDLDPAVASQQTTKTVTGGTFSVTGGVLTFTPNANYNGTASVTYTVNDNEGATSNIATVTITVNSVNPAPVASNDNAFTDENDPVTLTILSNDTDDVGLAMNSVDLNPGTPGQQTTQSVTGGTFSYAVATGILSFTPTTNFNGIATVTYTVNDTEGATSNIATVTVTVSSVNANPVANADAASTDENDAVTFNILTNDADDVGLDVNSVDLDPATAGQQTSRAVTGGTFTVAAGSVTFTPTANFNGTATTSYTVADMEGAVSNTTTITVTVNGVNPAPVANNDTGTTNENTNVNINILSNDTDDTGLAPGTVDLDPATGGTQTSRTVTGGTFTVAAGLLTFAPATNFNGTATVTYTVNDTEGATSNIATVTITVNSVNASPVANNDTGTTNENTAIDISILANDTDDVGLLVSSVDLDPSTGGTQTSRSVTGGTFTVNSSGVLHFVPTTNFNGTATVTYTVRDTEAATSNTATVTVTVSSVNANPVANNDVGSTNENTPTTLTILSNDTDDAGIAPGTVDLDPATAGRQTTHAVTGGTFTVNPSGVVTFTPTNNFNGTSTTTYTVDDNEGATSNAATITVTVNSINADPVAVDDATSTNENTAVTVNILSNDTDDVGLAANSVDLDPLVNGTQTNKSVTGGIFNVSSTGVLTFTPTANYNGSASVTYTVNDNEGATSNIATVTITVSSINTAPVAVNDAGTTDEEVAVTINILTNDTDDGSLNPASVDLDPSSPGTQSTITVTAGTFAVNASGVLQYTPSSNYSGSATVSYTVEDTEGALSNTATVTITVNPLNDPPVAVSDAIVTNEDVAASVNILTNDSDSDGTLNGSTIDIDVTTPGIQSTRVTAAGSFSVNSSGLLSFTPAPNYNGVSTIRYRVNDNLGAQSNNATITITVNAINDTPVAVNDNATTDQGVAVTITILANDTDDNSLNAGSIDLNPDVSGIQSTRSTTDGNYSVNSSGVVTFSPVATFSGNTSIEYTVSDNEGVTSNKATIAITVNYINQKPVATNDGATTDEDVVVTINVVANDTDDGSINIATVDLNPSVSGIQNTNSNAAGSWSVNASGVVTFTPTLNYNGAASLTYRVNDNLGETSNSATISVSITPINDPPVAVADTKTTNEDTPTTITVVSNDTDVDNAILASTVDLDPATSGVQTSIDKTEGNWSVNASGVVTFTPAANFFGSAVNSYTVNDNIGGTSNSATITVTVTAVNDVPIAINDQASTPQNQQVSFNVVTNDLDVDGTVNVATVDLDPSAGGRQTTKAIASGTFTVDNTGNVTFVPTTNFSGSAGIPYTVQDNLSGTSSPGTITVLVNFVNTPPVANNDNVSTNEDTPFSFNVLTNDTDDGSIAASTVDLNPAVGGIQNTISTASGKFDVNASGNVTFTPALNFSGSATASYTVNDNLGATSNTATITVTVTPVNDPPTAVNDNANTNEDVIVNISVLANDSDIDGTLDPASIDLNTATPETESTRTTAQGTFTVNTTTGVVTFTPLANFNGSATLAYTVKDNQGTKSNSATITVAVSNINDAPTFDVIPNQVVLRNSATKTITITGISPGPSETEQILLSAQSDNTPVLPNPTITYSGTGATATLSFKPQPNQSGQVTVTVKAVDNGLTEFTRTFTVNVIDARITSTPVTTAVKQELYQYNLTTTPIDPALTFVATQKPAWATLTSAGKNIATLSGTPPDNAPLSSVVIIQLKDGAAVIDEQQFTLVINQRPTVASFEIETDEDVALPLPIDKFVDAFVDPDNDPIAAIIITTLPDPGKGILTLNATPVVAGDNVPVNQISNLLYTPTENINGTDSFTYQGSDGNNISVDGATVTITIVPVNDAPVISFIESEPLPFDIGLEVAEILTPGIEIVDVDSEELSRVEIGFRRPNFDEQHDVLEFSHSGNIEGEYDESAGILTLSGTGTVAEYQEAIRKVKYNFEDIERVDNLRGLRDEPRTIYVRISDGVAESVERERIVDLKYTHIPLAIPNVFTPDATGNKVWRIREQGHPETSLTQYPAAMVTVFNKRGQIVYEAVGLEHEWDGTMNGTPLPVDTYFYVIDLGYGGVEYKGTVSIFRRAQ